MGPNPSIDSSERTRARLQKEAEEFFEPQLAALGLSVASIESHDLIQLRSSLDRVNELIANPGQLGTFRVTAAASMVVIARTEATFEVGALPLLLQRKRLILDRVASLGGQAQASSLRDLVAEVEDADVRARLLAEVDQLQDQAKEYVRETRQVEDAARLEEIRVQSRYSEARLEMERRERQAAIRQRFLERESVATIVGGFLLIVLTCTLIVAMFTATTVPEILSNGFFIILGYFFGQTAARSAARTQGDQIR
jgi:hypothetical protein